RRQQFPRGKAPPGFLFLGEKQANRFLPVLPLRLEIGPVVLARLASGFRLVAVRAFQLDSLGVLAAVAEPNLLLRGNDLADCDPLASLGQDNALGHVVLVIEFELARVRHLVAEQFELGMILAERADRPHVLEGTRAMWQTTQSRSDVRVMVKSL